MRCVATPLTTCPGDGSVTHVDAERAPTQAPCATDANQANPLQSADLQTHGQRAGRGCNRDLLAASLDPPPGPRRSLGVPGTRLLHLGDELAEDAEVAPATALSPAR